MSFAGITDYDQRKFCVGELVFIHEPGDPNIHRRVGRIVKVNTRYIEVKIHGHQYVYCYHRDRPCPVYCSSSCLQYSAARQLAETVR